MKTKQQLLDAMSRSRACCAAIHWVRKRRSRSAEKIGLTCLHPEWMVWFLWKALRPTSRRLLASRLGLSECGTFGGLTFSIRNVECGFRPAAAYSAAVAMRLNRAVIDDCWRAWCRS